MGSERKARPISNCFPTAEESYWLNLAAMIRARLRSWLSDLRTSSDSPQENPTFVFITTAKPSGFGRYANPEHARQHRRPVRRPNGKAGMTLQSLLKK